MAISIPYYKLLQDQHFASGVKKVATFGGYPDMKTAVRVSKLISAIDAEQKVAAATWQKIVQENTIKPVDSKAKVSYKPELEVKATEFFALKAQLGKEFAPIPASQLEKAGISPVEILSLESILDLVK